MSEFIAIGVLGVGAILLAMLLSGCSDEPSPTPSARNGPSPTITAQPDVTPGLTPAPTSAPTNTSTPAFTPSPTFTPAPAITPTQTPVPAKYSVESVDMGFTGGGQGLVQTSFTVTVKNVGELPGTEPVKLELLLDDDERDPVSMIDPLAAAETSSFELSRKLAPGHYRVTFIVADSEMSVAVHVKAADITLTALRHVITGDGTIAVEVQVTNQGDLVADSVELSAGWVPTANDAADMDGSSGSTGAAVVIERLNPGESRVVSLPVEIPAGSYAFTLSGETASIEAFRDNNNAETTIAVDYVKLVVSIESVRHVGYKQGGDGIVDMDFSVANEGVTDSGELTVGVMCVDGGCFQSLPLDSLQAGDSVDIMIRLAMPQGKIDTLVFAGGLDEGYRWGEDNVGRVTVNVAERATVSPAQNVETAVAGGYWSDGTANVEVTPSLNTEDVQGITVTCSQRSETASACPQHAIVWPADGPEPSAETRIMRLPMGESYVLAFDYGGNENIVEVEVPERILGVERDVWECFRDTSNIGTVWEGRHGIGCGGWYDETITKWDQSVPVRVWANPAGDPRYIRILGEVLEELSPILNLQFQWGATETDATFVAHLGIDRSKAADIDIGCRGCIGTRDIDHGVIRWVRFVDLRSYPEERQIKRFILDKALRALLPILYRHRDQTSVTSGYKVVDGTLVHRMDQELFKLHSDPLVKPGMAMDEVREVLVLRDELLDRPGPAPLASLQMLEEAYVRLQSTGSAQYSISVRSVKCGEQLGWTDYKIANYGFYDPRWIHIDDGSARHYIVEHGAELWSQDSEQWREIGWHDLNQDSILSRYHELSPHNALSKIFRGYDDVEVEMAGQSDGELILKANFASQAPVYPSAEIAIVLDEQSYEIREYGIKWPSDEGCGVRELYAKDGRYGIEFEFPEAIWDISNTLSSCGPDTLGPISGKITREGVLPGSCGPDPMRNMRLYHFSLDSPRSAVNITIDRGDVTLRLLEDEEMISGESHSGDYIGDSWISSVLPAGDYTIEIATFDTRVEGSFELEIGATSLAGKIASVSSGAGFTCALSADDIPFCWGLNPNGQSSPPNGEKFTAISSGWAHTCALRADGSAVCWGNNYSGESSPPAGQRFSTIAAGWGHTCAITFSGAVLCWGNNEGGQSSPPDDEAFTAISVGWEYSCALRADGSTACWGRGRYEHGQSLPPADEKFTTISSHSGGSHTCALRADGSAVCWGNNDDGESSPPEGERFTSISSGNGHTCALRADGSPVCWGDNRHGGSSPPRGKTFTAISSGHGHTCGITQKGQVLCWGRNEFGEASPPG